MLRAAFLSWAEWLRQGTVYRSSAVAAERLLARYLAADYLFHARRRSASLIEPMTRASDIAYELVAGSAINILAEAVIIAALAIVLIVSAPPITLVDRRDRARRSCWSRSCMTRRSWERIGESERQLYQQQLHLLQQSLGAIKDVKVTGRQPFFEERFRHVKRELGATKQRRAWAATLARLGVEATLILSMLLVVFLVMRAGHVRRRHRVGARALRLHRLPRRAVGEPHHAERRLHARGASRGSATWTRTCASCACRRRGPTSTIGR